MKNHKQVLITGGTGVLGQALTPQLVRAGYTVRIMSRGEKPAVSPHEWAQAALATGAGLDEAVRDVHTIVHAASSPFKDREKVDVEGTGRLLVAAEKAGVAHFVYISIAGIDRVPFRYYQAKLAAEERIQAGRVPWTILRATQFHNLLDYALSTFRRLPFVLPLPLKFVFQPVDVREVAASLVAAVEGGPAGRLPDLGGPETLTMPEIAHAWLNAHHLHRRLVNIPLRGATAQGFMHGLHTVQNGNHGRITWQDWLQEQVDGQPVAGELLSI